MEIGEILFWVLILVLPGIVILVVFLSGKKFPIRVEIFVPTQTGFTIINDRAGRKKHKDGRVEGKLRKLRDPIKPDLFENMFFTKKGWHLKLVSPVKGQYQALKIDMAGRLKPIEEDDRQWFVMDQEWREQVFKGKKDMLTRLLPILMVIMFGVSLMLVFIGYGYFISEAGKPMQAAAGELNSAAKSLLDVLTNTKALGAGALLPKPPPS